MSRRSHTVRPSLLAALLLAAAGCAPAARPPVAPAPVPTAPAPKPKPSPPVVAPKRDANAARELLGNVRYDLPVEGNGWVRAELEFLVGQRREVIARWMERGDPYEPYVKRVLTEHGVPTDLYYLAMIESGFVPTIRSRAGAVGLWQFMPATGRGMGLRIDEAVDERMDPVRSTRAAARHLRQLHRQFGGDWALAAAAYNAGSGRIGRGMKRFGVSNFWDLSVWGDLAEETKRYVPRLYAVTIIGRDRARFGFRAPRGLVENVFPDSVRVEWGMPLDELARIGGIPSGEIARLNPHLVRSAAPREPYWVWVPSGSGPALESAYAASDFREHRGFASYAVREGDSADSLAFFAGIPMARLRELNSKTDLGRLRKGQTLTLPATAVQLLAARPARKPPKPEAPPEAKPAETVLARNEKPGEAAPPEPKKTETPAAEREKASTEEGENLPARGMEHTVAAGETLWGIARRYSLDVSELMAANERADLGIVPGQTLRIPASAAKPLAAADPAPPAERTPAPPAESAEWGEHVVADGETLWSISRRYETTVEAIQQANGLADNVIVPGRTLRVPR